MKTIKIFLLSLALLFSINTIAQTKEYTALLNKALNTLYADLPNNCKNLYGNEDEIYKGNYQSKIILPNSIENKFCTTNEYPIEFTSYTIAGDDKEKATTTYNNICKAVKASIINYKSKNYKLLIVETKIGQYPSITYKLENGPDEINEITISVFMHDVSSFEKKYKYRIGVGVYGEIDEEALEKIDGCESGNCQNGKGIYKFTNGDMYEGDFKVGKSEGQGVLKFKSGAIYTGSFKDGSFNGFGNLEYPDVGYGASIYIGNFVNGEKNGTGKYTESNGDYSEGEWKNNKLNGQGKMYFKSSNTVIEGIFKDDELVKEKILNSQKVVSEIAISSKEYSNLLGKAINSLYADMANNCKSLFGNPIENHRYSHQCKINIPNSIKNIIASYENFPVLFESNVSAGNDNEAAKQKYNEISKAILSTRINYKNKNYIIKYLAAESREGIKPHYFYALENGPIELENVKIYLKLMSNPDESKPYKFIIGLGVYKQAEVTKTETPAKTEIEKM
jgi:hypothetical protein